MKLSLASLIFISTLANSNPRLVKADLRYYTDNKKHLFSGHKAAIRGNDQIELFFPGLGIVKNLQEMQALNLEEAKIKYLPWSGDYWPLYRGGIGSRYTDELFMEKECWRDGLDYVTLHSASSIFSTNQKELINKLSPSEKYDLLFSRDKFSLTKFVWSMGKPIYQRFGEIQEWMGLCHGWAPASISMPEPRSAVTVKAYDGITDITFYPDDIKALATMAWAQANLKTNIIGGRCNEKEVETDDNGRALKNACFDNNPGTWHMAVVNQIGIRGKSFIIDTNYDYEVWNHPVTSYRYAFFNPKTGDQANNIEEGLALLSEVTDDNYRNYRGDNSVYVIGVMMEVTYLVEIPAEKKSTGGMKTESTHYLYDLELDENLQIIGGEWYYEDHPDFIWKPYENYKPMSIGDYAIRNLKKWNGKTSLEDLLPLANESSKKGQPLLHVVESLIELSNSFI